MVANMKLFQKNRHTDKSIDPGLSMIAGLVFLLIGCFAIGTGASYFVAASLVGLGFIFLGQGIASRTKLSREQDRKSL